MYEIERDEFRTIFNIYDPDSLIIRVFEYASLPYQTENFVFIRDEEDVTIIRLDTLDEEPQVVNWYKLYHIGRCLNLRGFKHNLGFYTFVQEVVEDIRNDKIYEEIKKWEHLED